VENIGIEEGLLKTRQNSSNLLINSDKGLECNPAWSNIVNKMKCDDHEDLSLSTS
jgi:hypothetical protein